MAGSPRDRLPALARTTSSHGDPVVDAASSGGGGADDDDGLSLASLALSSPRDSPPPNVAKLWSEELLYERGKRLKALEEGIASCKKTSKNRLRDRTVRQATAQAKSAALGRRIRRAHTKLADIDTQCQRYAALLPQLLGRPELARFRERHDNLLRSRAETLATLQSLEDELAMNQQYIQAFTTDKRFLKANLTGRLADSYTQKFLVQDRGRLDVVLNKFARSANKATAIAVLTADDD